MKDKEIRNILISFLKANSNEIRIYQEKSIGASVCDIMVVTDKLTGFEIKSDRDNFARLERQVKAYSLFFDKNYIVVGKTHLAAAADRVPDDWGIICILDDKVTVERKAKKNSSVSRRKQLTILWKLELKNILVKNHLPTYAQKEKSYIADRILERADPENLGRQIADELMRRDYSVFNATDYTEYYSAYDSSEQYSLMELVDTLSEDALESFTLDKWIELYSIAKERSRKKEQIFKAPVKDRTEHKIKYTDIEVTLGAPWIDESIINDFIGFIIDGSNNSSVHRVNYEPITGNWTINGKHYFNGNTNLEVTYGLKRYNALWIIEATLNLRPIKLYDRYHEYSEKDTVAALEKQRMINEAFKKWVWQDEDRIWQIEEDYNRIFTSYEMQTYDGSTLQFPDMDPEFSLFDYQKDAVQKIIQSKNTLLAFDVGAGKTFIMIAAAMKMRTEGLSRKNMFVVPNHIVGQWEKIFSELYPAAKILAIEPKSFKPEIREKILLQIKDGDYDGIIIAYSCFEMIPLSSDAVFENAEYQLKRINDELQRLKNEKGWYSWKERPLNLEKDYILKLTKDFLTSLSPKRNSNITFENLEVNTLFLDEAHNYKNLPIRTKLKNLNGINTKGSMKCYDMLQKVRCVQAQNNGRGIVFATGTPLCNSIADAYVMQMYLQYEELTKHHLDVFDNWIKTFALVQNVCEVDVDASKYRFITKIAKFFNLTELSKMFSQTAIFYAVNDDNLPELSGYKDTVIKRYFELSDYMASLCDRSEVIRNRNIDRTKDNMLKVSVDGRKAALDLNLVDREQPYINSKTYRCVKNVKEIYCRFPETTQIIFCDYSTPKSNRFNIYSQIKDKLIEQGISKKEIAFIHSYHTESKKVELFRRFNAGEIRILIGSTFKLGIGANVQTRLKAIHHLDVPWRPSDMIQREGRIIRKGNHNESVLIYRYIAEGSFDSYAWQILETKQNFISQFLSGTSYQRTISDLENNVLTYSEVKALALAQPLMKKLAEKENELKTITILRAQENETIDRLKIELTEVESMISESDKRVSQSKITAEKLEMISQNSFQKAYKELVISFNEMNNKPSSDLKIASVFGFEISVPECQDNKKPYCVLTSGGIAYHLETGNSCSGNARRVINFFKKFDKTVEREMKKSENLKKRKTDIKSVLHSKQNKYDTVKLKNEINEIKAKLNLSQ